MAFSSADGQAGAFPQQTFTAVHPPDAPPPRDNTGHVGDGTQPADVTHPADNTNGLTAQALQALSSGGTDADYQKAFKQLSTGDPNLPNLGLTGLDPGETIQSSRAPSSHGGADVGVKQVTDTLPNGGWQTTYIGEDGTHQSFTYDQSKNQVEINTNGTKTTVPDVDGQPTIENGVPVIKQKDGTKVTVGSDGSTTTHKPDGSTMTTDAQSNLTKMEVPVDPTKPDGPKQTIYNGKEWTVPGLSGIGDPQNVKYNSKDGTLDYNGQTYDINKHQWKGLPDNAKVTNVDHDGIHYTDPANGNEAVYNNINRTTTEQYPGGPKVTTTDDGNGHKNYTWTNGSETVNFNWDSNAGHYYMQQAGHDTTVPLDNAPTLNKDGSITYTQSGDWYNGGSDTRTLQVNGNGL